MAAAWPLSSTQMHQYFQQSSTTAKPIHVWEFSDQDSKTLVKDKIRRSLLQSMIVASSTLVLPSIGHADDSLYQRKIQQISYQIQLPKNFKETQKPLKTHLDEINFVSEEVKGYQFGITVDPVRINSLHEFGTPEEVAARVVTAEVNRDGIFEVTLMEDPYEIDSAYILHYLSVGKRGNKHYYNKIYISNNQLYVLTAQVKQDDFESLAGEMKGVVASFSTGSVSKKVE